MGSKAVPASLWERLEEQKTQLPTIRSELASGKSSAPTSISRSSTRNPSRSARRAARVSLPGSGSLGGGFSA